MGIFHVPLPVGYFSAFSSCLGCCARNGLSVFCWSVVTFFVEVSPSGWGWTIGLSRFPGWGSLCRCSGAWNVISSLWSAMECPVMSFEMGLCVRCDYGGL